MKKLLSAAAALGAFVVLGAGGAQADAINSATVWVEQPNASTNLVTVGTGTPIAIANGAQISFSLLSSTLAGGLGTVSQFLDTTPGWGAGLPAAIDGNRLSNGVPAGGTGNLGSIFQFTGSINLPSTPTTLAITHDDGAILNFDTLGNVINQPGAQAVGPPATFSVPGSLLGTTQNFTLTYGECCSLPAVLEFTVNGVEVTNTIPEPASLALLGSALVGLGVFRRRRRTS